MFNKIGKLKTAMFGSVVLALTVSASSQAALTLVVNGDFENGNANWGTFQDGGNGSTATFETSGGNGGGYGLASDAAGGWGAGFVHSDNQVALADYGLSGGSSTVFSWDMKDFNGWTPGNITGIKIESWNAVGHISNTANNHMVQATTTDWTNYTQAYTFDPAATHMKIVLVGTDGAGLVGFDNLMIDAASAPAVPIPAAAWLFGSALAGLVAARRRK